MWLDSKMEPTVTVNSRLHGPQRRNPARAPLTSVMRSKPPQRGQYGPLGQTIASSLAIAAASMWKCGSERMLMTNSLSHKLTFSGVLVKYIIPQIRERYKGHHHSIFLVLDGA